MKTDNNIPPDIQFEDDFQAYCALRYTDITSLIWKGEDGWEEDEIRFWPTYKRDESTGIFRLKKGEEGRLPGYADRIIINNGGINGTKLIIKSGTYNSLPIIGSDHLPVICEMTLK